MSVIKYYNIDMTDTTDKIAFYITADRKKE